MPGVQLKYLLSGIASVFVTACDCVETPATDNVAPQSWITLIAESGYDGFSDIYQVKTGEAATEPLVVHIAAGRDFTIQYGVSDAGGVGCVELDWAETTGLPREGALINPALATRKDFNAVPECIPGCPERSFLRTRDISAPEVPTKYEFFLTGTDAAGNASRPRTLVVMHDL
jgi:hypothetical protein